MSSVRMCDQCGNVFSEREDGWTSMQAQRVTRKDGRQVVAMENLDACPECSSGANPPAPKLRQAITAPKDTVVDGDVSEG